MRSFGSFLEVYCTVVILVKAFFEWIFQSVYPVLVNMWRKFKPILATETVYTSCVLAFEIEDLSCCWGFWICVVEWWWWLLLGNWYSVQLYLIQTSLPSFFIKFNTVNPVFVIWCLSSIMIFSFCHLVETAPDIGSLLFLVFFPKIPDRPDGCLVCITCLIWGTHIILFLAYCYSREFFNLTLFFKFVFSFPFWIIFSPLDNIFSEWIRV